MSTTILHSEKTQSKVESNEDKKTFLPQLRFSEFGDEWVFKKIEKIAELTSSKRVYLTDYVKKGIPFYRGKEITELKLGKVPSDILYITESSYNEFKHKYGVPEKDDLLITAVGTLGNVFRIKEDSKFYFKDGNLIWFRKILEFSPFLEIILDVYKEEIKKTSIGSTQRALTMVELRKLNFPFPSVAEQQKIASFLSAVDEKIQQLSRKKELLEQYKKGVMQQLFSGKLRFKDENGEDYPDWEEKKLGDIADFYKGKGISKSEISEDGINECIRYGELYTRYGEVIQNIFSKTNFDIDKAVVSQANDVIIPASGETKIDIATASCVMKSGVILGGDLNIIRTKNNGVFLSYYLNSTKKIDITNLAQGISVVHLYSSQLALLDLNLSSLPEQQKIANFLSSIDAKIENTSQQINQIQNFKKGLLQQMFV